MDAQRVEAEAAILVRYEDGMVAVLVHLLHAVPVGRPFGYDLLGRHGVEFDGRRPEHLHGELVGVLLERHVLVGYKLLAEIDDGNGGA